MKGELSFGEFLQKKRIEKGITLREMARILKISAPYLSDIQKGKRNPFNKDRFDELEHILLLTHEERIYMYDLAGKATNTLPADIGEYIMANKYVRDAIREAIDRNAGEEDWRKFVDRLNDGIRRTLECELSSYEIFIQWVIWNF